MSSGGSRSRGWWFPVAVLAVAATIGPTPAALAHEGEEEIPAETLVRQAIVLIRGQPDQVDAIEDKIADALAAEDSKGVDLALVERAMEAFDAGDLHEAQDLLEESIGAAPHEVVASPNAEPGAPADEPTPVAPIPVLHETTLEGSDQQTSGGLGLVVMSVLLAGIGSVIVWKVR